MAAGTIVSRLTASSGRMLLVAALGSVLHADLFTIANTLPNMLYILVAGGIFNAVLVPQLVRRMKNDPDGGDAYASRIVTLSALFLGAVTILLVARRAAADAALPGRRFLDARPGRPPRVGRRLRPLLPAAGLLLRDVRPGRPDPQRPRPVRPDDVGADRQQRRLGRDAASSTSLIFGPATDAEPDGGFPPARRLLLGLGSTIGIVAQFLVLVPYLRARGLRLPAALRLP